MILSYNDFLTENGSRGIVNGKRIDYGLNIFSHESKCPFCNKIINDKIYETSICENPGWLEGSFYQSEKVIQCPACGWWEYEYFNQSDAIGEGTRASDVQYSSAILKKYDDASKDVPVEAVRKQILKTPDILYHVDANVLEDVVRSVLSDFYPSCKVYTFGKTRDGGKDGLLVDDNGNQFLLQVKRRTNSDATEGVEKLRELMGVSLEYDNVKGCIFVSTAHHYSNDAKKYAERMVSKNRVDSFELIDCEDFIKKVDLAQEKMPSAWEALLRINR